MAGKSASSFKLRINLRDLNLSEKFKDAVLGRPLEIIPHSRLPIKRVVLQHCRYVRNENQLSDSPTMSNAAIASQLAQEVQAVWNLAHIPTHRIDKIKDKILKLIDSCRRMMKHCERYDVNTPLEHVCSYEASLDHLFDISVSFLQHSLSTSGNPSWKEDWKFYENQCQVPQIGSMGSLDKSLVALNSRKAEREEKRKERCTREAARKGACESTATSAASIR